MNTLQRTYAALAMAIEDGTWNDHDPRAEAIIELARTRGVSPVLVDLYADPRAPQPVRERAFACVAGKVLACA